MGFPDAELSITLVDDRRIAELARAYGRPPRATDVLAFALAEGPGPAHRGALLGDVVISVERADAQARARRVPLDRELRALLIHGTLHLLGMDHVRARDRVGMRALEDHLRREVARLC